MNYCYVLSSSSSPTEYRYIGETNNLKYRLYTHLFAARKSKKRWALLNWITKHVNLGEKIILTPICVCDRDTYEITLIAKARELGWNILNIQDGGTTSGAMKNKKHSSETKQRMSLQRKGVKKTQAHKDNIADTLSGRTFSTEHLHNLSVSAKTKPKVSCEHCGISLTKTNYTKWHGNKCRRRVG